MRKLLNERVPNRDVYSAMSRYRHAKYFKREISRNVVRVEPETWDPPTIPESELTRMTQVSPGEEGALDLISLRVYGTEQLWWVIALANDIIDPFDEVVSGSELKYPPYSYVMGTLLT